MTREKVNFELTGVPHTLLIPLLGRAMASQDTKSSFHDARSLSLIKSLNYNFDNLLEKMASFSTSITWAGDRALYFDNEIKTFLHTHPNATIVNLGAGLETAFYRVDNGMLTWVDLDVPEVMNIRHKLLPPPKRVHYISKSIFDYTWLNDLQQLGPDFFFFAGGLFIYFTPEQVKSLFIKMANQFPGTEMVFDSIAKDDLTSANEMFKKLEMIDARFQWGIDEKEVEAWSPKIKILKHLLYHQPDEKSVHFRSFMTKVGFLK